MAKTSPNIHAVVAKICIIQWNLTLLNQRKRTMPRGKRRIKEPPRQTAWMMMRTGTEDGSGLTLMSAVPEMVGMVVEEFVFVEVMSTKNVPMRRVLVRCECLRFRSRRTVIVVLIDVGILRIGSYCIAT